VTAPTDCLPPYPVQCHGNRLAAWCLRRLGWSLHFQGLPAAQGVLVVYPHTSNWDFPVMMLAKWALGVEVRFWGKDRLFRIPLFGRWLRWIGGVPVARTVAQGATHHAVQVLRDHMQRQQYFWLGLAPEGTRKRLAGWRSGFYRTAYGAGVPLGLVRLDWGRHEIHATDFIRLCGDEAADLARIAAAYAGVTGRVPGRATPIRLLEPAVPRTDTIMK